MIDYTVDLIETSTQFQVVCILSQIGGFCKRPSAVLTKSLSLRNSLQQNKNVPETIYPLSSILSGYLFQGCSKSCNNFVLLPDDVSPVVLFDCFPLIVGLLRWRCRRLPDVRSRSVRHGLLPPLRDVGRLPRGLYNSRRSDVR